METAALVAPVTALEFLQDAFLLTGEGPVLKVYSLQPRPKACASLRVLQHARIHGIRPRSQPSVPKSYDRGTSVTEPNFYDLAVFGGKVVRLVRLHVDFQDGEHMLLEIQGPLMKVQDWVLDVRWLSGDAQSLLCVAVAHNRALVLDVVTGSVLVQRACLEGCLLYSALLLVHKSWADTVLVGGTVFNQLVLWKPGGGNDSESKAPVERRLHGHSGVIFSISYLQEKGWLASASDDRSVRLWGVGLLGGPEGECGDVNPACLRVLYGHQARVFSVCLSSRKVFSAGEDGTCLVWDWAGGGKVVRTLKGHRAGGVRALAVSAGREEAEERWVATGGADGGVRLWKVKESEEMIEEAVTERLNNLKFPGQGLPKVVCIAGAEKGSWSCSKFVVNTDQGIVYMYSNEQWEMLWHGTPEFQSYCVMETISVSVKHSTAKVHLCAVGNLSGSIHIFPISHPQSGIFLSGGSGKIHSLIWRDGEENVCLLASGADGLVYRWCIEVKSNENCSLTFSVTSLPPFALPPCAKRWLTAAVCLLSRSQDELWVCGDRRGSLLLFQESRKPVQTRADNEERGESLLTCMELNKDGEIESDGDEQSSSVEQRNDVVHDIKLQPVSCLFGVHGKQGVTSVYEYQGLLYSTGRDGCVRVFRVQQKPPENLEQHRKDFIGGAAEKKECFQLVVLRVQRACRGMEWLERVLFLKPETPEEEVQDEFENCYKTKKQHREKLDEDSCREEPTEDEAREARFVIVGFHAVHFVVWDPVKQERLLAVPCGGGHRSWSLWPCHKGVWPGYGALVFIKQGAVLSSQPPREKQNWAGQAGMTGGWSLTEGIHGRGIGCVSRLGSIQGALNDIQTPGNGEETERREGLWEVVVTGGEDTSLSVLAIHPDSGSIKTLSVITDHISSVRTVTAVMCPEGSEGQSQCLSALLVSAGGRAQMHCYRLLIGWDRQRLVPSCQVVQVAGHRLDEQWERRRNRHKMVKMDPETRYMSVVVVDKKTDSILLALGCSDGAVRLFSVREDKQRIDLLWETFFHQRCVLSVATCCLEDRKGNRCKLLFSAATDGKIAVWNLTEDFSSIDSLSDAPTPAIPCLSVPAHQSGVNSLAVWTEEWGQLDDGCLVTVASGGDDGQLTVSSIRVQFPENGKISESQISLQTQLRPSDQLELNLHSQSHIPLAHAAPLTALKLLSPGLLVSTSSDQRVCLWRVCSTGIGHRGTLCCHVADAAGLAVWEGQMMEEEEEGDKMRKTQYEAFESQHENAIWRVKGCRTQLETKDEAEDREPVEVTGDPGKCEQSEVNTEKGCEIRKKREKTGWVLICGQGLQLLRVRDTESGKM